MHFIKINILISFLVVGFVAHAQSPLKVSTQVNAAILELPTDTISVLSLEQFIKNEKFSKTEAEALHKFYGDRDFRMAWLTDGDLTAHGQAFWDRFKAYLTYSKDSTFYDAKLYKNVELLISGNKKAKLPSDISLELSLTHQFYTFVQRVYIGRIDPVNFDWHIPRKKATSLSMMEEILSKDKADGSWLPVSEQYLKLRTQLIILQNRQKQAEKPIVLGKKKLIKPGDTSIAMIAIKKELHERGDLKLLDTSNLYAPIDAAAVMDFQQRHGLGVDGVIGPNVIKALNIPLSERIKKVLINMERMRWLPEQKEGVAVWINIPEYKLYVFENKSELLKMDIVVGRAANRTVIFSDKIQHIVFSPYWHVPESIVRNEIIPAINRNGDYLSNNDMEVTGRRNGLPVIRQKPGSQNSLGKVKFIFPNQYDIYLHDTPSKHLFGETSRAFSHGCIRLSEPFEFARFLLKDKPFWTDIEIDNAMNLTKEKWVKLTEPVPVLIGYFTAWVDAAGQLNFREDIYGHDKRMAEQLFRDVK